MKKEAGEGEIQYALELLPAERIIYADVYDRYWKSRWECDDLEREYTLEKHEAEWNKRPLSPEEKILGEQVGEAKIKEETHAEQLR